MVRVEEMDPRHHEIGQFLPLMEEMQRDTGNLRIEFDSERVMEQWFLISQSDREYVNMWLALDGDEPVGFFIGSLKDSMYSRTKGGYQELWYTSKRHGRAAILLFEAFENWCIEKGASEIFLGIIHTDPKAIRRFKKLGEHLGFRTVGIHQRKDL